VYACPLMQRLHELQQRAGVHEADALRAASWRPARMLGDRHLLDRGATANLALFDEELNLVDVVFRGASRNRT